MKIVLGIGCLLLLVSGAAFAQNNSPMSLSTEEHGPGDRLTLFVTFQEPMPKVNSISCYFGLSTPPEPRQTGFRNNITCANVLTKDSETQYRVTIPIDEKIATGQYKLSAIGVTVEGIGNNYQGKDLPELSLKVKNPKDQPNFAPIKDLKLQKAQ
jgi:hypothetical protein